MNGKSNVAVLVGSLRKNSCNRRLANALAELAPGSLRFEIVEISRLSPYNKALDEKPPREWIVFRQQIRAADGLLFMTPECHRAVPGVLRNALDIGSHSQGENAWEGKPCGVVSVSMNGSADSTENHLLHRALVFLNVPVMQRPQACIGNAHLLFDDNGELVDPSVKKFLREFIGAFDNWVRIGYLH